MAEEFFKRGNEYTQKASFYYEMGKKQDAEDEIKKALEEYNKAHEIDPSNPEYYRKVGELFLKTGKYQDAIEQFNKAIEMRPGATVYYIEKGTALNNLNKYEEALKELDKAISLNPKNSQAYLQKSISLKNLGNFNDALSAINLAIQYLPKYTGMEGFLAYDYEIKASILMALGNFNDALSILDEADKISPVNKKSYNTRRIMRANLLNLTGKYPEALDEFTSLLKIDSNNAFFHYGKAIALENLGKYELAKIEIENAVQLNPTNELFNAAKKRINSKSL